uniref:Peptidase metallopeptidase domain-containing protein n=1 Tax=Oryza punctata TaxID=4537 RepID=A0A0E0MAM5_ORYPU
MFPRRRGDAACLLLLAIVCILSCVAVADARPAPPPVSRYAFMTGKPRWARHGRPMVLTYAVFPTDTVGYLPRDAVRAVFRSAFARWAEVIPVSFAETTTGGISYDAADIKVGFYGAGEHGDGHPFDGPLNVCAHATGAEDGHIDFDAAERWAVDLGADASPMAVDLETVATHEIGHALGLDHSSSQSSVMYPYVGTRERKVRLTVDDVEGIQELYGVNPSFSFLEYFKPDHDTPSSRFWRLGLAYILLVPL